MFKKRSKLAKCRKSCRHGKILISVWISNLAKNNFRIQGNYSRLYRQFQIKVRGGKLKDFSKMIFNFLCHKIILFVYLRTTDISNALLESDYQRYRWDSIFEGKA